MNLFTIGGNKEVILGTLLLMFRRELIEWAFDQQQVEKSILFTVVSRLCIITEARNEMAEF